MKKFFRFMLSEDAFWIWVIVLAAVFSFTSCGKEEEKPSKQVIEECIVEKGYDNVFDYLTQNYSFNEIFNEIIDRYGKDAIMDEAVGSGWVYDHVADNPDNYADLLEGFRNK